MSLIGYARVSTEDQSLNLQKDALYQAGCVDVYEEVASGARMERPQLAAAVRCCQAGPHTLVVWKLDRLGRTVKGLIEFADELATKGIGLKSLQDNIDTTTPAGKCFFTILAAFAELERN